MNLSRVVVSAAFVLFSSLDLASAKEIPVQGRLFAGMETIDPKNVNETIEAQGLKKFESINRLGIEITYPLHRYLDIGVRYTKRLADVEENPENASTDYSAKIDQDSMLLLARVPLFKTDLLYFDLYAGVGGSNTTLKVKTASQDGEFTRRASGDWVATPYAAAGASFAIGYKKFYLVFEGGYESNKVDGFTRTGSASTSIDTLDLSGGYFSLGLMFDGVPGTIK
ncbi:hypothetical protein AZI87_02145 [Bdellovibrio bacteriovorus]|uniref:Outer membrane protein beta-barrel domain-containing protein n=1 Tax=Bdellovibrio bacteriovorus TaxID=959 RepID=A0A161PTI1_BDEBC|nr:hypothetical protein [Bdellovibrio bacteriovorus]KYG68086.1 hypothetical protein AZI87_02145 [Bdellovibrio bacteriovorus]